MTAGLSVDEARRCWARAQGLGGNADVADVPGGWTRALGGASPYLAMRARCADAPPARVNAAIEARKLWVGPGVRGCIWLMPAADRGLALAVSAAQGRKAVLRDITRAGATPEELEALAPHVLDVLASGPKTTHALRNALPAGTWRSLGDAGKKVGLSSTLPPALRLMEWDGRLGRVLEDHRLDHERYTWALPPADAPPPPELSAQEQAAALATRFFSWAGPATLDAFRAWSKLGKRAAQAAIDALELIPVQVQGHGSCHALAGSLDVPAATGTAYLLDGLDNMASLRARPAMLADPRHHDLVLPGMSGKPTPMRDIGWLYSRPVVVDGAWVGTWEWDPVQRRVVVARFGGAADDLVPAARSLHDFIETQLDGVAREFSIDSEKRQRARVDVIAAMPGAAWTG